MSRFRSAGCVIALVATFSQPRESSFQSALMGSRRDWQQRVNAIQRDSRGFLCSHARRPSPGRPGVLCP